MNDHNNIPAYILKQYHKMGFKLIPICDDGVTPNVTSYVNQKLEKKSR